MSNTVSITTRRGEVGITLRVTSEVEMYRWAWYHAHGPVDWMPEAQQVFRYLRRRWGTQRFVEHDKRVTGGRVVSYGWHLDENQKRL